MTAVPDPQEALREQIARAIHGADCGCAEFYQRHDDPALDDEYYQRLTDAVLPVVQAHTQALRDEIADRLLTHVGGDEAEPWQAGHNYAMREAARLIRERAAEL